MEALRLQVSVESSVPAVFEQIAKAHSECVALKADGGLGRSYTYGEVLQMVRSLAAGLCQGTYRDNAEVGLLSENRPEWPIAYLGILAAGKTVVPIDATLKAREIAYILEHSGVKLLFTSGRFDRILKEIGGLVSVFCFDGKSGYGWSSLFRQDGSQTPPDYQKTAVLIYTSGTTGTPKAVELTHRNLVSNVTGAEEALGFDQNDVFLSVLPLHHTFETTCGFLTPLLNGASVVYARSLKSREILEDIRSSRSTCMCGVPLLYEKMYQSINRRIQAASVTRRVVFKFLFGLSFVGWRLGARWGRWLFKGLREKAGLGSMRMFVSGSAALPPKIARFFNLIGFDFLEGYGMTECSPVISVNCPDSVRFGSVGPPLPGVEVRIHDPDGRGIGEIIVKGENITPGYRGNSEMTADLIRDGWLYTGDLGRLKDGQLWITGRAKNVIVSAAGKNIYPEELEEKLIESKYILEAVVFGRKKQGRQGEEVRALVVPDVEQFRVDHGLSVDNPDLDRIESVLKEVVSETNHRIAGYKRIVGFHFQLGELDKTATIKIKRFLYE